jgi:hypothetical protein
MDGGYICPVCFWENDPLASDSNHGISLNEAKENFLLFGASDKRLIRYVRKPTEDEKN